MSTVELQFHTKIESIQTDWGGEFRSFTSFLATNGITHTYLSSFDQNVVERKHRHITELGLT